jgi:hypothetical protein
MLSSRHLFALACATFLFASVAAAQNSNSQPVKTSDAVVPLLRRVVVRHLGSFDSTMLEEVSTRVLQIVYRPRVGTPYDQHKVGYMKKVLQELWKERGVSVAVNTQLTQIRDTRYALLEFVVYKP